MSKTFFVFILIFVQFSFGATLDLKSDVEQSAVAKNLLHRKLMIILKMNQERRLAEVEAAYTNQESQLHPDVRLVAARTNR